MAGSQRVVALEAAASIRQSWSKRSAADRYFMLADLLAEISSEALQGDSLEAVLKRIVDCIIDRLPVTVASIILLDESHSFFIEEVWSGHIDLVLPSELPWPVELGAAGRCVRTGRPQLILDVANDPDYVPGNSLVCSEYLVPIRHRDTLHGVLNLESTSTTFFTNKVCAVFDAVALQIAGAVHLAKVVRELEIANRKLEQLSMCDGLTNIANRRHFDDALRVAWDRQSSKRRPLGLLLVDVDCFKLLNDSFGHQGGDECLRLLASHCAAQFGQETDLVARFGGEEFAILLPGRNLLEARRLGEQLRQSIAALGIEHPTSPVANEVTVSIGVSSVQPRAHLPSSALVAVADRALYLAKAKGRNAVVARSRRT